MTMFYRFLLAWAEFDITLARSTGRNPANIAAIQADIDRWELALLQREINA